MDGKLGRCRATVIKITWHDIQQHYWIKCQWVTYLSSVFLSSPMETQVGLLETSVFFWLLVWLFLQLPVMTNSALKAGCDSILFFLWLRLSSPCHERQKRKSVSSLSCIVITGADLWNERQVSEKSKFSWMYIPCVPRIICLEK